MLDIKSMFNNAIKSSRNKYKMPVIKVFERAAAQPVGIMRKKVERIYAAASYDLDSYKGQIIFASINGKRDFISIKCNREDTYHDQYEMKNTSLKKIMNTYRDNNNLKCLHFVYEIEETGERFTNQNAFIAAVEKYCR